MAEADMSPSLLLIAPILQMTLKIYHHSISNQPLLQDGDSTCSGQ